MPAGLNPGDKYHLVFVTSGTRDATSVAIGDYNTFVDDAMGTIDDNGFRGGDITWVAIASTSAVDARNNMSYLVGNTAPVYRLDGTKVADNAADLWDSSIDATISIDENGDPRASSAVWTGSTRIGTEWLALGGGDSTSYGLSSDATTQWIQDNNNHAETVSLPFYGFSEELVVVPEPGTISLAVLSLAAGGAALRRRRRKAGKK